MTGELFKARYRFGGMRRELDATRPPLPDEQTIHSGLVRVVLHGWWQPTALLRLTTSRLLLVRHRAVGPDLIWDVPRAAVIEVRQTAGVVVVEFAMSNASSRLALRAWTRRVSVPPRPGSAEIYELLHRWWHGSATIG